ncbi:MAG: ribonuclease H-like domain-containing protein [Candidatus Omnitrophota bacterium]|nr:ribonuclease H-like domain-containing protein [Candidatus Omnitrophota bacterium]
MNSKNILVLDLETQKSFKEVGKANLAKLKVSVVGVYDYAIDEYLIYEERDIMALEKRMQDIDLLIGFNIRRFDMPVLQPYLFKAVEEIPVLDLLEDVERERGHRASLDSIAGPTLKKHKSGHGADALILYQQNKMEELKRYCLDDVRLTKEVYEFGVREGKIFFTSSWDYKTYDIPVSWAKTSEELIRRSDRRESSFPSSLF